MGDKKDELLQIFLEEASDLIASLSVILRDWETDLNNLSKIAELKRDLHTLKGSARMVGQMEVGSLAHEMETLSDTMAKGERKVERSVFDQIVSGLDFIGVMIEAIQKKESPPSPEALIQQFKQTLSGKKATEPTAVTSPGEPTPLAAVESSASRVAAASTATPGTTSTAQDVIRVRATLLETLNRLSTENNMMRVGLEQHIQVLGDNLAAFKEEIKRLQTQVSSLSLELQTDMEKEQREEFSSNIKTELITSSATQSSELGLTLQSGVQSRYLVLEQFSKVMKETLFDLNNTYREMVESQTEMETLLLNQTRVGTELQHRLSDTRLVPFESIVPRLSRISRQVATELKKKVDFKILKTEGEMDRTTLEHLVPSLEHILRNALDHGIESPETRLKQNKPETGKIEISFLRQGSVVAIEIVDDGAGMDIDAIRKKAIKLGMIAPDAIVSDEEAIRYILEPGFSTREAITEVSGRGVGMDVVNTAVKEMGGTLNIASEKGSGTQMTIRFPFTSSLNRILLFNLHSDIYGMLLSSMEGIGSVTAAEAETLLQEEKPIFKSGEKSYCFHYLGEILNVSDAVVIPKRKTFPVILIPSKTYPMALMIDSVLYTRELLVQSLGAQFKLTNECSGATLLGDGRVVLILDPNPLSEKAKTKGTRASIEFSKKKQVKSTAKALVMVVDDSASARAVATRLLESNHYQVVTAKDGIEALQKLQELTPDIFMLDIDMPRMDGLELARTLKEDKRYQNVPIIMVTALANKERREEAKDLKIEGFIEKPYDEAQLLLSIHSILAEKT